MNKFEEWFVSQYFYTNMRFVHGDALFDKDGDFFRILAVQIAWEAWQSRQAEVDQLREELAKLKDRLELAHHLATQSTWSSLKQLKKVVKALRGENANS